MQKTEKYERDESMNICVHILPDEMELGFRLNITREQKSLCKYVAQ